MADGITVMVVRVGSLVLLTTELLAPLVEFVLVPELTVTIETALLTAPLEAMIYAFQTPSEATRLFESAIAAESST